MPAIASISLNDSTATARAFVPKSGSPAYTKFEYAKYPDLRGGNPFIEVTWSDSSSKRKTVKQGLKVTVPLVRPIAAVNTVIGAALYSGGSFTIPDDATAVEVADLHAFVRNALANAAIQAGVINRDPLY